MTAHSNKVIAGIDPGKTGAMVILYPDNTTIVCRVPLAGKNPAWSQWSSDWATALDFNPPDIFVIEEVGARPGQGVTSMFKFGRTLGFAHGLIRAAVPLAPVMWVTPAVWKRKMGLTTEKTDSREEARRLMPRLAPDLARVKDDGVAEAALLAHYLRAYGIP
jgi:crossover junction endodeoxyribonuclease RuvC